MENQSVVIEHVMTEVERGCLVGPLPSFQVNQVHVSPIGLVQKPHTNRWSMIVDLLMPSSFSVNNCISSDSCSLTYALVDKAVDWIRQLGHVQSKSYPQLVKMDLKDAYRIVPVHPHDQHLLVIRWQDEV